MSKASALLLLIVALLAGTALYHHQKPLPPGMSVAWPAHNLEQPQLLIDQTWVDDAGNHQLEHQVFDEVLRLIGQARRLIVVDMFLFNDSGGEGLRPLSRQLTEALLARRAAIPDMRIVVISDPFNTFYGGIRSPWFEQLRDAGITVVETPLSPLRDSNPLWSTPWRLCCQWLGNTPDRGWLPTPVSDDRVTLRSYLALLNFKANHRKALVVDYGDTLRGLVSSANPHDASSRHSNVALAFGGAMAGDLLASELSVLTLAGIDANILGDLLAIAGTGSAGSDGNGEGDSGIDTNEDSPDDSRADSDMTGRIVTEGKIGAAALAMVEGARAGDRLELAMFYLSHRPLVQALIHAHQRGVAVRVLLDANRDAFGMKKDGVPNRPVARDLHRAGIPVRWSNTHGEQFHTKAMMRRDRDGHWQFLLGSANFTRRNLDDYNLETNILVHGTSPSPLIGELTAMFERHWQQGPQHPVTLSLPYSAWQDESSLKYWRYRVMEATGLSTF